MPRRAACQEAGKARYGYVAGGHKTGERHQKDKERGPGRAGPGDQGIPDSDDQRDRRASGLQPGGRGADHGAAPCPEPAGGQNHLGRRAPVLHPQDPHRAEGRLRFPAPVRGLERFPQAEGKRMRCLRHRAQLHFPLGGCGACESQGNHRREAYYRVCHRRRVPHRGHGLRSPEQCRQTGDELHHHLE